LTVQSLCPYYDKQFTAFHESVLVVFISTVIESLLQKPHPSAMPYTDSFNYHDVLHHDLTSDARSNLDFFSKYSYRHLNKHVLA